MSVFILSALQMSIALLVFSLALNASVDERLYLLRRPGKLVRSLFSMNIVMPLFAAALVAGFNLRPAVKIALITLAVSPVPPLLPRKQLKAGGHADYVFGLLIAAVLFAIVFVPVAVAVLGKAFGVPARMGPAAIAMVVFLRVLVPLGAGLTVRYAAPELAERIVRPLSTAATILLVLSAALLLISLGPAVASLIGNGTLAAFALFCITGITVGHLLGGPEPANRTVLALATATRHPAVALTIANANFPQERSVFAALVLYLLVSAVVSIPYLAWRRRESAGIESRRAA